MAESSMRAALPLRRMNILIAIFLLFALLGAVDKILGGKLGVSEDFDRGLAAMGPLCLAMTGVYCIAVAALSAQPQLISAWSAFLPFDPSVLAGSLLASDLGGYAISKQLAASPALAMYSGLMLSSTLGCLISFVLPTSLGNLKSHEVMGFMQGVLWGIVAMPVALTVGGLLVGLPFGTLLANLWPVLVLCVILCLALRFTPRACIRVLSGVGLLVRTLGIVLFCIVALGIFVPAWSVVPDTLFYEALTIVFKCTVVVCGSTVACGLLLAHCGHLVDALANRLHMNRYAIAGLFVSFATSLSMLPLYSRMDTRGKVANAAFASIGAFVFGGQMAFISSVSSAGATAAYIVCKLVGGALAVALALRFTKCEEPLQAKSSK